VIASDRAPIIGPVYEDGTAMTFTEPPASLTGGFGPPRIPRQASMTEPGDWQREEERLASRSLAAGDPTGWFDRLYAAGATGRVQMPWNRAGPHPLLAAWAEDRSLTGLGRRAVVAGCGLGADAEYLAGLGFDTVGFDIS
jgi:hypothetical protein